MKFFSPSEQPIHVALTSGHTAIVEPNGIELPKIFWNAAIHAGAKAKGSGAEADELQTQTVGRELAIREALTAARDSNSQDAFNKDGTPDLRKLIAKLGFPVSREEVDALWAEVIAGA